MSGDNDVVCVMWICVVVCAEWLGIRHALLITRGPPPYRGLYPAQHVRWGRRLRAGAGARRAGAAQGAASAYRGDGALDSGCGPSPEASGACAGASERRLAAQGRSVYGPTVRSARRQVPGGRAFLSSRRQAGELPAGVHI
jgi:hypothetical protein